MKTLLLLSVIILSSCSIAPTREGMKTYAHMAMSADKSGTVAHMDTTHSRFEVQPKEYADSLMASHCKGEYEIVSQSQDIKTIHMLNMSTNAVWIMRKFNCK